MIRFQTDRRTDIPLTLCLLNLFLGLIFFLQTFDLKNWSNRGQHKKLLIEMMREIVCKVRVKTNRGAPVDSLCVLIAYGILNKQRPLSNKYYTMWQHKDSPGIKLLEKTWEVTQTGGNFSLNFWYYFWGVPGGYRRHKSTQRTHLGGRTQGWGNLSGRGSNLLPLAQRSKQMVFHTCCSLCQDLGHANGIEW